MAYEQREGSGSLFKNDFKKEDKHPDYKGSALINGIEMDLAAWVRKTAGEKAYMSLSIRPKSERPSSANQEPLKEEDLPF